MSKYDALWAHIQNCGQPQLTLTFDEIGRIAGQAVLAKFAETYFRNELQAGTPFTFGGATVGDHSPSSIRSKCHKSHR